MTEIMVAGVGFEPTPPPQNPSVSGGLEALNTPGYTWMPLSLGQIRASGFTAIEILIVLAILGILTAVAVQAIHGYLLRAPGRDECVEMGGRLQTLDVSKEISPGEYVEYRKAVCMTSAGPVAIDVRP